MENKKLFLKFIFLPLLVLEIARFMIPAVSIFETSTPFDVATVLLFLYVSVLFVKTSIIKNIPGVLFWWFISLAAWSIIDFVFAGIHYSMFSDNPTLAGYLFVIIVVFITYIIYTAGSFLVGWIIGTALRRKN